MHWMFCLSAVLAGMALSSDASSPRQAIVAEVVSFRQGTLSGDQVAAWLRHHPPNARLEPAAGRRQRIEERVVMEVLNRRFVELGLEAEPEARGWQRQLERRLAAAELRRAVTQEVAVPEAEVEAAYLAAPHRFDHEPRWQLLNLFKRYPAGATDADRERLHREMARLHDQLEGGANFAELARKESDSATRERSGSLASAPLADLHPAVAKVVSAMKPGDLSPVIETEAGLTLLRCTGIVPAVRLTPEEVRTRLRNQLRGERIEREWDELSGRLVAGLAPVYHLSPLGDAAESAIATVRRGAGVESIERRDLELYLRDLRSPPPAALATDELRRHTEELLLQLARAWEAEQRGLTATDAHRERLALESLAMRAELALAPEVRSRLKEPTEQEIATLFEKRREQLVEPSSVELRTLEIPLRKGLGAAYYQRVQDLGSRLTSGSLTLEQARDELAPHARLRDRGWLSAPEAWKLGRNVEVALARLAPGQVSPVVQEGRLLLILHLVARREERPLTLEEARPQLAAALFAAQRERIRAALWAELVAEQEIRIAS